MVAYILLHAYPPESNPRETSITNKDYSCAEGFTDYPFINWIFRFCISSTIGKESWYFQSIVLQKNPLILTIKFGFFFPKKPCKKNIGEVRGRLAQLSASQTLRHGYLDQDYSLP